VKKNRMFYIVGAIVLIMTIGLTVREVAATTTVVPQYGSSEIACASLPSRYSIRNEYVEETDVTVLRTEDGPTGVDGGLIDLLSRYRTCSK